MSYNLPHGIVSAVLEPWGSTAAAWSPWEVFLDGEGLVVRDVAGDRLLRMGGSGDAARNLIDLPRVEPWWIQCLGLTEVPADVRLALEDQNRPAVFGAAARGRGGEWVLALNDPRDVRPARFFLGHGTCVMSVLEPGPRAARSVSGLAFGNEGEIVFVDNYLHVCRAVDRAGRTLWSYGGPRLPGARHGRLSSPAAVALLGDLIVIANEMSGRLTMLKVERGNPRPVGPPAEWAGRIRTPTGLAALDHRRLVVTDGHGGRLFLFDVESSPEDAVVEWVTDQVSSTTGPLAFPRGMAMSGEVVLVADTANHRVVAMDVTTGRVVAERPVDGWPRALLPRPSDILVGEALRKQLGVVPVLRATSEAQDNDSPFAPIFLVDVHGRSVSLGDPHHLEAGRDGAYWLVDSDLNDVLRVAGGRVLDRWAEAHAQSQWELDDPHQVHAAPDDSLLVLDTGNGRILRSTARFGNVATIVEGLVRPRALAAFGSGWMVSHHTGQLLTFDRDWRPIGAWELRVEGAPRHVDFSDPPRSLLAFPGGVLVSDWQRGVLYNVALPPCRTDVAGVGLDETDHRSLAEPVSEAGPRDW